MLSNDVVGHDVVESVGERVVKSVQNSTIGPAQILPGFLRQSSTIGPAQIMPGFLRQSFGERVMKIVQNSLGEEINVLQSSDLRQSFSPAQIPLTGLPRSDEVAIDHSRKVEKVLSRACFQSEFDLNLIQMEVEGEHNTPTGRFRRKQLNPTNKPIGSWPEHWVDEVHEDDGHSIGTTACDRGGENMLKGELSALYAENGIEYAVDDVSGALLDPKLVHEGRSTEMKFFNGMNVYDRVPRSEQATTGGKIIGTKWIDVNKGDIDRPNIRCRLVGKGFRTTPDDALYASTPPLEALRIIMSRAVTWDEHGCEREIMTNDVSRAYFYAEATRCMYIELPREDPEYDPDMLGRLRLCLYGTRDAALNWQQTLSDHLVGVGFKRGVGHPSVFHHPACDIWTLVHGDDYCSAGSSSSLDWLEDVLAKKYEIKTQRVGRGKGRNGQSKKKEGQVLNRVVRSTENGWELEADLRHAELIVEQLGLSSANPVSTPGIPNMPDDDEDDDDDSVEWLSPAEATVYRAIAARCVIIYSQLARIYSLQSKRCADVCRSHLGSRGKCLSASGDI